MAESPTYESVLLQQREQLLDTLARGLAGIQGRPIGSSTASEDDEDQAWMARDPKVTAVHLAQIAEVTAAELAQETDEMGRPLWNADEIKAGIRARQEAAAYPWRHLVYTMGTADPEEQYEKARDVSQRVARRYGFGVLVADQWSETPEGFDPGRAPAPGLADLMGTGGPPRAQAPGQEFDI